jgi:hypothetical protein
MDPAALIGVAASLSLLAGWRLYAVVLVVGLVAQFRPEMLVGPLAGLAALGNWWVIGVAGAAALIELLADKVPWLDSAWDAVHTLVRPVGGALLALTVVQPNDPTLDIVTLLLGGGAAMAAHTAKAGGRAILNTSPEPVTNILASTTEDLATGGGLYLVPAHPAWALGFAAVLLVLIIALLWWSWRILAPLWRRWNAWGDRHL